MFNAGGFMEIRPPKVVWGRLLYFFLLNVYMHDFDQFVGNLGDACRNMAVLCHSNKNNHKDLTVQKCGSPRRYKFSNQMLKIYDESVKYKNFLSSDVANKGRPLENV